MYVRVHVQWVTGTKNMRFSGRPQNILNPKNKATGRTPNILISPSCAKCVGNPME